MGWGGRMMVHPVTGKEVPDPADQVVIYKYLNARAAEWPEADYVVSNPPFIGNSRMRESLGDGYTTVIREVYKEVPETVDFVMYWWYKSSNCLRYSSLDAFGLITTNSISQIWQRKVIENEINHKKPIQLFFAIPDHPWVDNGAAVRIAMTAARLANDKSIVTFPKVGEIIKETSFETIENTAESLQIKYRAAGKIFANLQTGVDISSVVSLKSNQEICNRGVQLIGQGFSLTEEECKGIESEAVYPYANGRDLLHASRNVSVIDLFGMSEDEARSRYPQAYQWLYERVKPERDQNNRKSYRETWWLFGEPRASLRPTIESLHRYIATVETAKHRTFLFLDKSVVPDNKIIVIALADSYCLGVLSGIVHVIWALACGSQLGPTPVYPKTICFDPFPFPIPTEEQKQKICELGDRLDSHRKQVQSTHPEITITGMYNLLEKLRAGKPFTDKDRAYNDKALVSTLKQIHDELDAAVLDAYGWPQDITDEQILENLVALNAERAEEERNGLVRWLRPDYQAPDEVKPKQVTLQVVPDKEGPIIQPVNLLKWPTKPKAQLAAIRDLLRTTPGEWTAKQIAAQFKGNITQKKLATITDNLERLEWFGLVILERRDDITYWHYAEAAQAA